MHNVPQDFGRLSLIHLNFNKNNFNVIPHQISKIKTLRYLHLQNNEFFSLPEATIFAMPNTKINLLNNPLQLTDDKVSTNTSLHCVYLKFVLLLQIFTNVIITGTENHILDLLGHDSDSSSDNWDASMDSSDLNYSATESDSEDEEVLTDIPRLSKYLLNF